MDPLDPLGTLCPECGSPPGIECWGDEEHAERHVAAAGGTSLGWWPEYTEKRIADLAVMPYREYLDSPEWAERREAIRDRAGYRCEDCGRMWRLQVHHVTYERRGWEWPSDLKLLCGRCHTSCHPDKRGASVSYGAYVQACIDERRRKTIGNATWDYAAVKYANDNFSDFPEEKVITVLREMRWPDRPVTVGEVLKQLRLVVTTEEQNAWLEAPTS